jgi:hypothetical protein
MSLFRQQALEQRRLPDPMFTPVTIVMIRRWMWVGAVLSFVIMAGLWLLFGTIYTTYQTSAILTGETTSVTLPSGIAVSTDPLRPTTFMATCPDAVHGIVRSQDAQNYTLLLEQPVHADCHITIVLRQERPLERLFR